jgi:HYDIN/CFA65/VesB-like, Ig-like domain
VKSSDQRELRAAIALSAAAILIATAVSLRAAPRVSALGTRVVVTGPAPEAVTIAPGITVDLRKLPKLTPGEFRAQAVMPQRVPNPAAWMRQQAASATTGAPVPTASAPPRAGAPPPPMLGTNFMGIDQPHSDCPCEPPDTNVAAGPSQIVEVVNLALEVFTKSGGIVQAPVYLNDFFNLGTDFSSDPKVRFDPGSQRWFVSMLSLNGPSPSTSTGGQIDLAVSSGADLSTANWTTYKFPTPSALPDQPDIGFSADKLVLSANSFSCASANNGGCNSGSFLGNEFFVIDKADLTAMAPSPRADFYGPGYDSSTFSIQPARMTAGSSPQPTTLYMAAVEPDSSNVIHVFAVDGLPNSTTVQITSLPINNLNDPPNALQPPPFGIQPGQFTGDNRLQDAVWQDGSLWVSANSACKPQGDISPRDCLRFIQVLTDTMEVNQDFDYGTPGTDYYYPAVAIDQSENLLSVFSRSSSSEYPSVYFASRLAGDPLDAMSYPVLIQSGKTDYTGPHHRWGDYSGASVDPSDGSMVWVGGEYATLASGANWGTWIAEVQAGSSSAPTPSPSATPTPTGPPGKLRLSTHRLGFGKTRVGAPRTRAFKIKNRGKGALTVSLTDPGAPFSIVGGPAIITIPAKQKIRVAIQFAPGSSGKVAGALSLTSDDPRHPLVTVTLAGKGVGP